MACWFRGKCIGNGSFGTVNLAVDKSDGRIFAVKSVELTSSYSSPQLQALEREIKVLKSLSSPYVVDYYGDDVSAENPTTSYRNLHMEYMPGGTAADVAECYYSNGADADEGILRAVTSCIVSGLKYVHALGIVHCDVKGRNVLLGSTPGVAKLADFGSAAVMTAEIRPRGSPLWMAPEVVRGEYQGPESDVWSLGCTVIEMVTGKPAWEDRGLDTLCRIGYSDDLPEYPTNLSKLGLDFLSKCLKRNFKERWSCDQLLQHPFLLSSQSSDKLSNWSPRCVLDWSNCSFNNDDQRSCDDLVNFDVKDRIGKLATSGGVVWEDSDDQWVTVRTMSSEQEDEIERINLESVDEIVEEYSDYKYNDKINGRSNLEIINCSDGYIVGMTEFSEAGSSCGYGAQKDSYNYCNLIFSNCWFYNNYSFYYYYYYYYSGCKCRSCIMIIDFVTCNLYWSSIFGVCDQFLTTCCSCEWICLTRKMKN